MKADTRGKGTCVWCEPGKLNAAVQDKKKLAPIVRALKQFKAKDKYVYDLAKSRIPEVVKELIDAAGTKSAPRSAFQKQKEAIANAARKRLRVKTRVSAAS